MPKENKTEIVKVRLTPKEKSKLETMARNENIPVSILIREKIFSSEQNTTRLSNQHTKQELEKINKSKLILSELCSSINQFKASVDTENAFRKIEQGVSDLCHSLN